VRVNKSTSHDACMLLMMLEYECFYVNDPKETV